MITVRPLQAQPIPQRNDNHHTQPNPVVNEEDLAGPRRRGVFGPGDAIEAAEGTEPNHKNRPSSRFHARKCEINPHRGFVLALHVSAFNFRFPI